MRLLSLLHGVALVGIGLAVAVLVATVLLQPSRRRLPAELLAMLEASLAPFWREPPTKPENYLTGDRRKHRGS